jgi:hypothetical protein
MEPSVFRSKWSLFGASCLAVWLTGCAGDPLVGAWRLNDDTTSPDQESQTQDIIFNADNTFGQRIETVFRPTASNYAGCTQRIEITSGTWSTSASGNDMLLTLSNSSSPSMASLERTNCVNEGDNISTMITSTGGMTSVVGTYIYRVEGDTLRLTTTAGALSITITLRRA